MKVRPVSYVSCGGPLFGLVCVVSLCAACAHGGEVEGEADLAPATSAVDGGREASSIRPAAGDPRSTDPSDAAVSPTDDGGKADGAPSPSSACAQALSSAKFDFDNGPGGFTHGVLDDASSQGVSWPFDPWAHGTAQTSLGCKSGQCWATELSTNYAQCQRAYLESPAIDLSSCANEDVSLSFEHAYTFWSASVGGTSYYDGGIVEVSNDGGNTWMVAGPYTYPGTVRINPAMTASYQCVDRFNFHVDQKPGFVQTQTAWQKVTIPIGANYRTSTFMVRFSFGSGVSSQTSSANTSRNATGPGWHVDDVAISL